MREAIVSFNHTHKPSLFAQLLKTSACWTWHIFYFGLDPDHDHDLDHDLDPDLDPDHDPDRDLDRDPDHDPDRDLDDSKPARMTAAFTSSPWAIHAATGMRRR